MARMGFGNIKSSSEPAEFVKIDEKKGALIHLLEETPFSFRVHWTEGQSSHCKGKLCALCLEKNKAKTRYAINVYDMVAKKVSILEQGAQVFGAIEAIWEAYEKDLSKVDLHITKTGSNLETKYSVVPVPSKFKTEFVDDAKLFDLEKRYGGEEAEEPVDDDVQVPF